MYVIHSENGRQYGPFDLEKVKMWLEKGWAKETTLLEKNGKKAELSSFEEFSIKKPLSTNSDTSEKTLHTAASTKNAKIEAKPSPTKAPVAPKESVKLKSEPESEPKTEFKSSTTEKPVEPKAQEFPQKLPDVEPVCLYQSSSEIVSEVPQKKPASTPPPASTPANPKPTDIVPAPPVPIPSTPDITPIPEKTIPQPQESSPVVENPQVSTPHLETPAPTLSARTFTNDSQSPIFISPPNLPPEQKINFSHREWTKMPLWKLALLVLCGLALLIIPLVQGFQESISIIKQDGARAELNQIISAFFNENTLNEIESAEDTYQWENGDIRVFLPDQDLTQVIIQEIKNWNQLPVTGFLNMDELSYRNIVLLRLTIKQEQITWIVARYRKNPSEDGINMFGEIIKKDGFLSPSAEEIEAFLTSLAQEIQNLQEQQASEQFEN